MDVLPRQNDRRAVAPARKASSPVFVPPSFMPASGILQQQLKKGSLGAEQDVVVRAPPAYCRRGTPVRGGIPPAPIGNTRSRSGASFSRRSGSGAALWAAPLDSFAQSAAKGYSQEASGTALEPP